MKAAALLTAFTALTLASQASAQSNTPLGAGFFVDPMVVVGEDENRIGLNELTVETPTLENLGFEWAIDGDANRNAVVAVAYRVRGETEWRTGMDLIRLRHEDVSSRNFGPAFSYVAPNMFAGSVLDLTPDTEYEVRFTATDPDGVVGVAERTVRVRTRPEPMPATDGRTFHVYPEDWTGPKQEPAYLGLLGAYNMRPLGGDYFNASRPRVRPGDVILVHAGVYRERRFDYAHELISNLGTCCGTLNGTYFLTAKGTTERPIVIKAAGDGEVIFDGAGVHNLFNVMAADYHYFEGITVRNTDVAFEAGLQRIAGSRGLTIKNSVFYDVGVGIHTDYGGSRDFYIADNRFTGRHYSDAMFGWPGGGQGMLSEYAIKVYGPGHVITHNEVRNFHDGIDHATYGDPEGWPDTPFEWRPSSIDITNNLISNMHDNCIEADGSMQNMRVMRNVCINSFLSGFSMQPLLGGPVYFIRNVMINAGGSAIKFSEGPAGGVFYNNTFTAPFAVTESGQNLRLANNLFLQDRLTRPTMRVNTLTDHDASDHNGFYRRPGGDGFYWISPEFGAPYGSPQITRQYDSLEAYQAGTGRDTHSLMIDYSVFRNVALDPDRPSTTLIDLRDFDFRLRRGAAAIDRGMVIPNVTDGYNGRAPDLGAIEFDDSGFVYGPRTPAPATPPPPVPATAEALASAPPA